MVYSIVYSECVMGSHCLIVCEVVVLAHCETLLLSVRGLFGSKGYKLCLHCSPITRFHQTMPMLNIHYLLRLLC